MISSSYRFARLRDLFILFLANVAGTVGIALLIGLIVSKNSIYLMLGLSSWPICISSLVISIVAGIFYIFIPGPYCKSDTSRRINPDEGDDQE